MIATKNTLQVSVVIPNWNGKHLLKKHMGSVLKAVPGTEVIVADDGSTDGSAEYLRSNFPSVRVIHNTKHEGFASNVNSGVTRARGDIVVLLNTDVAPEEGFLPPLLTHFQDPDVFAAGCLEKSSENGKVVLRGRGLGRWVKGFFIHNRGDVDKTDTAWVAGGSGAFRRTMWDMLGGLDTLFNPFYWEDIDISYRARKSGWKTIFEPKSIVHHYHQEGKIKKEFDARDVKRIAYRNQFIFIWKNLTDPLIIISHVFWTPIRLIQSFVRGDLSMLEGYVAAIVRLPVIMSHRAKQRKLFIVNDRHSAVWE